MFHLSDIIPKFTTRNFLATKEFFYNTKTKSEHHVTDYHGNSDIISCTGYSVCRICITSNVLYDYKNKVLFPRQQYVVSTLNQSSSVFLPKVKSNIANEEIKVKIPLDLYRDLQSKWFLDGRPHNANFSIEHEDDNGSSKYVVEYNKQN